MAHPTVKPELGSAAFRLLAPGIVAALIPASLTGWEMRPGWLPLRVAGVIMIVAGTGALVHAYVRNPMYLAMGAIIIGQAALLAQPGLLLYAAAFFAAVAAFVYGFEQPTPAAQYDAYRQAVPAWWPRLKPWTEPGRPEPDACRTRPGQSRRR